MEEESNMGIAMGLPRYEKEEADAPIGLGFSIPRAGGCWAAGGVCHRLMPAGNRLRAPAASGSSTRQGAAARRGITGCSAGETRVAAAASFGWW